MTGSDKNTLQYMENTIASARPEDLTLMMYNGLMKFIGRAQEEIRAKSLEAAHNTLIRCQDIVFEFQYTLNMDYPLSNNLMLLYDYLYNRLIEANAKKDCGILDEVLEFVTELRDTWAEAIKLSKEQKPEAAEADGTAQTGAETAAAGEAPDESAASAPAGVTEVEVPGASVRIGSDAPAAERNKAIYKRTGMPAAAGFMNAAGANAAAAPPIAAVPAVSGTSAVIGTPAVSGTPANPESPDVPEGSAATAMPAIPAVPAAPGMPAGLPVPEPLLKRINPAAAAQYAKVSKAKIPPREIISLASE